MEKIKIAKKEHICECCELPIKKGDEYLHITERKPKYAECENDPTEDGPQIGFHYLSVRVHKDFNRCWMSYDCKNDIHKYEYFGIDIIDKPGYICSECGCYLSEEAYKLILTDNG